MNARLRTSESVTTSQAMSAKRCTRNGSTGASGQSTGGAIDAIGT